MDEVTVYYTRFDQELPLHKWQYYIQLLPPDQLERNRRYHRWQDRHAHLLGRMLLNHGWQMRGKGNDAVNRVQYDTYARPFIDGDMDFNISHAGNYVVCAIGSKLKLGIDIEQKNEIELTCFENTMSKSQWATIYKAPMPSHAFLRYWSMKEAVLKADGRGLSLPMSSIVFDKRNVCIDNRFWYLHELFIDLDYNAYLACNNGITQVRLEQCFF